MLNPNAHRHGFIVLEGVDGAGKTTTGRHIATHVRARGRPLNRIGQHSWLDPEAARVIIDVREHERHQRGSREITEAYFHDKQLQSKVVTDLLRDRSVLCDRYIFSDAVYLEVLYGIPARETLDRHHTAGTLFPDAILYLDVPVDEAVDRVVTRGKGARHYENGYTLDRVGAAYRHLFFEMPPDYLPPVHIFRNTAGAHEDERLTDLLEYVDSVLPQPQPEVPALS